MLRLTKIFLEVKVIIKLQVMKCRPYLGVNMRGYYTSMPQSREGFKTPFPANYYENSLELLSKTKVIDHVRYRFYWESYERDPGTFIKELEYIAKTADKYGIKVIYDNHQFHTSSWLSAGRGTGFPAYLFNDPLIYKQASGGASKYLCCREMVD